MVRAYHLQDQRDRRQDTGLDPAWAIPNDDPPSGAIIGGNYEEILEYLKGIWGEGWDVEMADSERFKNSFHEEGEHLFLNREGANSVLPYLVPFPGLLSEGLTLIGVRKESNFIPPAISRPLEAD